MLVVIDGVGIRGQGGAAVLCELLHWLPKARPSWRWHVFLLPRDLREFDDPPVAGTVAIEHATYGDSGMGRLLWVHGILPARLRDLGADLVFSMANIGSSRPRVPQVVFCHQLNALSDTANRKNSWPMRLRMRLLRPWILRGAMSSEAVIVQTETMKQGLTAFLPDLAERVRVIPSGYRTSPGNPKIRDEKRRLIDGIEGVKLVYVSHPHEHKNHEALLRAIPLIAADIPSVKLLLTVEPPNRTDPRYSMLADRVRREAARAGVDQRIAWLGTLTPDEVSYALAKSDLMVFPSLAESFGLPLAEAMAAGCPIAAADLPYAHDVAGDAAAYFDPHDPRSLADCVVSLWRDGKSRAFISSRGVERSRLFSYEIISEAMATVLDDARLQGIT